MLKQYKINKFTKQLLASLYSGDELKQHAAEFALTQAVQHFMNSEPCREYYEVYFEPNQKDILLSLMLSAMRLQHPELYKLSMLEVWTEELGLEPESNQALRVDILSRNVTDLVLQDTPERKACVEWIMSDFGVTSWHKLEKMIIAEIE